MTVDADDLGGVSLRTEGARSGRLGDRKRATSPTKFAKIVVTDDRGRFSLPDLPKANYSVWVRGYGLVDSAKVTAAPGKVLNLTATVAPDAKAAATTIRRATGSR